MDMPQWTCHNGKTNMFDGSQDLISNLNCVHLSLLSSWRIAPPMDPKEYRKFTLVDKVDVSPNTAM